MTGLPKDIWVFLIDHWAIFAGIGTVITVLFGWLLTYRGWGVAHRNAVDLEKRKAELGFVSDQIRYLYGPLSALSETRSASMEGLRKQLAPEREFFFDGGERTAEEKRQWRLWRTEVLMPLVVKMEEAILQNVHLIDGTEMPQSFVRLMTHVAAYKVVIRNWSDAIDRDNKTGSQSILQEDHVSVINFPEEFRDDVGRTYKELKVRQAELLARTQAPNYGSSNNPSYGGTLSGDQLHQNIREYGIMILKSLLVLNGGAILAIFGLIGASIGRDQVIAALQPSVFIPAFSAYATGLVLVMLSMMLGFFNWQYHGQGHRRAVSLTYYSAIMIAVFALFSFIAGCMAVYCALV